MIEPFTDLKTVSAPKSAILALKDPNLALTPLPVTVSIPPVVETPVLGPPATQHDLLFIPAEALGATHIRRGLGLASLSCSHTTICPEPELSRGASCLDTLRLL